jgi:ABC-type multidrug transport system ATPase subunit/ABC-type multidrug transport system permease subunit
MQQCPTCRAPTAAEDQFCRSCGKPLAVTPHPDATVRWTGALPLRREQRSALPLETLFAQKARVAIGRSPDCDICLSHPSISRVHALLERTPHGLRLRDMNSVNGTLVGGRRIAEPVLIAERERFGVGPFLFWVNRGIITSLDSSHSLCLEARGLERVIPIPGGTKKVLENINLVVEPGEFVCLLGPSGSGKSTLMDALNGRRRATGGQVLANGEDFYRHFDSFRQSLGYVPQKDIVHSQLTVYRALHYTAELRLPDDTAPAELRARVEDVLREMELTAHRDTLIGNLSGGQIKRVSLGAELLARPCLLYIDEATSGLDAGTEARMMRLFRTLADEGKSIICITHNIDNVDRCHLAAVLVRGRLVYLGPPAEAPGYFGVARLGEVYDRLAEKEPEAWEKEFAASSLHQEFIEKRRAASPAESGGLPVAAALPAAASSGPFTNILVPARGPERLSEQLRRLTSGWRQLRELFAPVTDGVRQFRVLTARYAELLIGDRRSLGLLCLQAPLVALFILLGFANKPYREHLPGPQLDEKQRQAVKSVVEMGQQLKEKAPDPAELDRLDKVPLPTRGDGAPATAKDLVSAAERLQESKMLERMLAMQNVTDPRYNFMLLNLLAITVMWFGCNNAAKEIVKEEAIYGRERAVNLGIVPYLGSKFLLLSIVSALQALLLLTLVFGGLWLLGVCFGQQTPAPEYRLGFWGEFGVLSLLSMAGVAAGLLLSACVNSPDRANALLPYVLIPQIILGGGLLPVRHEPLHGLAMVLSPVYWAYRGIHQGATKLPPELPMHMDYDERVWIPCVALLVQTVVFLLLTAWFLRRKDVGR